MQSINRSAVSPVFRAALFGTGAACLGIIVWSAVASGDQPVAWVLAGAVLLSVALARGR